MLTSRRTLLATAGLTAAALSGCSTKSLVAADSAEGVDGETASLLRIGSITEPQSWDPSQAQEGHPLPLYQAVYDSLLRQEPDGTPAPGIATDWSVSEDLLSVEMTLREGVTFTDGEILDGEAVKANIENMLAGNGPFSTNISAIESVEVTSPTSITLHLSEPDPSLIYWLSSAGALLGSPQALGSDGIVTEPVGSGPYILDTQNSVTGSKLVFTRNNDYWDDPLPFETVEFHVMTDETARLNALKSGQLDACVFQRNSSAQDATAAGLTSLDYQVNWEGLIFFDRDGSLQPEFADPRVREALTLAIDRTAIMDTVQEGRGTPTNQTLGEESLGYSAEFDSDTAADPDRAKQLLQEAGAEGMSLTLPISPVFDPAIYDAIIQSWQSIGVTVERKEWGPGEAVPSMLKGENAIAYMSLKRRADWAQAKFLYGPSATWNPRKSEDEELSSHLHDLQHATDDDAASAAAKLVNEYIVENHWFGAFYRLQAMFFHSAAVEVDPADNAVPYLYFYRPAGV